MSEDVSRRSFLESTILTAALGGGATIPFQFTEAAPLTPSAADAADTGPNMIGGYGPWASGLTGDGPARLSFLQDRFHDPEAWRPEARARVLECLAPPASVTLNDVRVEQVSEVDGLHVEQLSWQLSFGPRTRAVLLKPSGVQGRLPAVLGLHDHGGKKFFGHEKITQTGETRHPLIVGHQQEYYGGVAWANELAKRGYAVLVHDTFAFASRKLIMQDVARGALMRHVPVTDESDESILAYNRWAGEHEHLMAKSLFCAGTTWPGVFLTEDQRALDYLCSRADVDEDRVGCAGLSGGGLRTVYLGGIDDRIRCACCSGMMTTWRDYLLYKCHTHTWMIYIPLLPRDLDYSEILGMRTPLPTLVQNCREDSLFTVPEMQRADEQLKAVFEKAGAFNRYRCTFYRGTHRFDQEMQTEAFNWFDMWLS